MSYVRRLDAGEVWGPMVALVMILALAMISFVLVHDTYAPIGTALPAARSPAPAMEERVPPERVEAERAAAEQRPAEQRPVEQRPAARGMAASAEMTPKSRRALETIDSRELVRQGVVSQENMLR